jgi:hypothetical protein
VTLPALTIASAAASTAGKPFVSMDPTATVDIANLLNLLNYYEAKKLLYECSLPLLVEMTLILVFPSRLVELGNP